MSYLNCEEALTRLVDIARREAPRFGPRDAVLRDVYGRLTLFLQSEPPDRVALETALTALAPYVRPGRAVMVGSDGGAKGTLSEAHVQWLRFGPGDEDFFRLVDRRVVGADWLLRPAPPRQNRLVFASMKGGVGRTTALCVAASDLAAEGSRVLVIDLDLEAPGVGRMLCSDLPPHGVVDALAAQNIGLEVPIEDLRTSVPSTRGTLDVVPAYGRSSVDAPAHYLSKLSRAASDVSLSGSIPLALKVSNLVDRLSAEREYDAILIDARAGMSEISAGPILALGATVLLFGTAQRQTFDDYAFLFAQLHSLGLWQDGREWDFIVPVLAKATTDITQLDDAQARMFQLFQDYVYVAEGPGELDAFNYAESDEDAPHRFIPIAFDSKFASFDPQQSTHHLLRDFYEHAFIRFLPFLRDLLALPMEPQ